MWIDILILWICIEYWKIKLGFSPKPKEQRSEAAPPTPWAVELLAPPENSETQRRFGVNPKHRNPRLQPSHNIVVFSRKSRPAVVFLGIDFIISNNVLGNSRIISSIPWGIQIEFPRFSHPDVQRNFFVQIKGFSLNSCFAPTDTDPKHGRVKRRRPFSSLVTTTSITRVFLVQRDSFLSARSNWKSNWALPNGLPTTAHSCCAPPGPAPRSLTLRKGHAVVNSAYVKPSPHGFGSILDHRLSSFKHYWVLIFFLFITPYWPEAQ